MGEYMMQLDVIFAHAMMTSFKLKGHRKYLHDFSIFWSVNIQMDLKYIYDHIILYNMIVHQKQEVEYFAEVWDRDELIVDYNDQSKANFVPRVLLLCFHYFVFFFRFVLVYKKRGKACAWKPIPRFSCICQCTNLLLVLRRRFARKNVDRKNR